MLVNSNRVDIGHISGTVLVFGGPYSNLQATESMRLRAGKLGIDPGQVICTGDTVAYCGQPDETVDLIREWGCHVVKGNCEESIGNDLTDCGCGFEDGSVCAALSVDWYDYAVSNIRMENKAWMRSLPTRIDFSLNGKRFCVIHGSANNYSEFLFYSSGSLGKENNLDILETDCVIGGHCGLPFGQALKNGYWLNPGVIGIPANDGTCDTWFALLEPRNDAIHVSWHSLEFNYRDTIRNMQSAGLPPEYRDTLQSGIWPSDSILPKAEKMIQGVKYNLPALTIDC